MSYGIARKLCEMDGTTLESALGWPASRGDDMTQRGDAIGRESVTDPELALALGHNYGRWHEAVVAAAVVLARRGERHSKVEWQALLDELQSRIADMLDRKS